MANQLQKSIEMTQAMSDMTDLLLANSLVICSRIERDPETQKPLLILTTENTGKIPIPGLSGTVRIGNDDNAERNFKRSTASRATLFSCNVVTPKDGSKTESKELTHSIYQLSTAPVTDSGAQGPPEVLLPGSMRVETFELDLERFDEWIIKIEANFCGLTSRKLFKRHECCVYLIDQCIIEWIPGVDLKLVDSGLTVNMMTAQVRQVMRVPVTEGILVGMSFIMKAFQTDFLIKGTICGISEDTQRTQLVLSLDSGTEDMQRLVRIRMELGLLGEHPQPERSEEW
ncbi:hypothetical protein BGX28_002905 [Mortierella sp. GBA30]|nr:hypothetical protein BGX28_002905 [Mortierella sp. GBA30]